MKATLSDQLIRVEQQFLLAVAANDEKSLKTFAQEWTQLAQDVQSVKVAGGLDENTTLLLSHVARAIDNIACCILESGTILQEAQSYSMNHFLLDVPPLDQSEASHHPPKLSPCHLLFSNLPSATAPGILGQQRLLDSYAYHWLMQNIHNPYPTSVQLQIIGDVSGTSVAQVELWFQEVRDEIGWTKLSREFFAGSIDATVAAAQRVYLEGDMDVSFDIMFAFTSVKASAETFFSEHSPFQSESANEAGSQTFRGVGIGLGDPSKKDVYIRSTSNLSMPSETLSTLSVYEEDEVKDATTPPSVAGRKRHLTEEAYTSQVLSSQRPEKRLRTLSTNDLTLRDTEDSLCSSKKTLPFEPITTPSSYETSLVTVAARPSCPTNSEPSLSPPASISRKREREGSEENPPERTTNSLDSPRVRRRRRLSDSLSRLSPLSPDQSQCPLVIPESNPLLESDRYSKSTLPNNTLSTERGPIPSMSQIPIDLGPLSDLRVYDWGTMRIPLPQTSQPVSISVPGSDLPSLDATFSEKNETTQSTLHSWTNDLGPLEDVIPSLQFPLSMPPGLSSFSPTSRYWEPPPVPLQNIDSRNVSVFIEQFPPDFSQSPSSSSPSLNVSSSAPSTPDNLTLSPTFSPFHTSATDKSAFIWDSSTPPSDILPGLFHDMSTPDWGFLSTLQAPLC
ncbi:hypothetical protein BGW80DRAFT_1257805 [Lactifluus volemus]|nr:hypothetical protein BGW80DRAFT_1257805 [Lactifluus volemus]